MGMDLLAVNPSAEARRFERDGARWGLVEMPGGETSLFYIIGNYTLPPEGPFRAQFEHRAGAVVPGGYSNDVWRCLLDALPGWGVSTDGFPVDNSGRVIPRRVCRQVASALSAHLYEYAALLADCSLSDFAALDAKDQNDWVEEAKSDIEGWRTCGGYAVW
jgi:hypothetical protein